jgi:hypothetical protein
MNIAGRNGCGAAFSQDSLWNIDLPKSVIAPCGHGAVVVQKHAVKIARGDIIGLARLRTGRELELVVDIAPGDEALGGLSGGGK